jgi:hypothetical protein
VTFDERLSTRCDVLPTFIVHNIHHTRQLAAPHSKKYFKALMELMLNFK